MERFFVNMKSVLFGDSIVLWKVGGIKLFKVIVGYSI